MTYNDITLENCIKALEAAEKSGNITEVSKCYNQIAMVHQRRGDYDKALDFSYRALEISKSAVLQMILVFSELTKKR